MFVIKQGEPGEHRTRIRHLTDLIYKKTPDSKGGKQGYESVLNNKRLTKAAEARRADTATEGISGIFQDLEVLSKQVNDLYPKSEGMDVSHHPVRNSLPPALSLPSMAFLI